MATSSMPQAPDEPEFLKIVMTRGDIITKRSSKGHQGYEITFRFSKGSHSPHTIIKVFDGYRKLKTELEKLDIGQGKRIPITSDFPPTFASSALGIQLSEDQLRQRSFMLGKWICEICGLYSTLSSPAKAFILNFLELDSSADQSTSDPATLAAIIDLLERGQINVSKPSVSSPAPAPAPASAPAPTSAPASAPAPIPSPAPSSTAIATSTATTSTSTSTSTYTYTSASARRESTSPIARSTSVAGIGRSVSTVGVSRRGSMEEMLTTYGVGKEGYQATTIGERLVVSVVFGKLAPKTEKDTKIHVTYDTCLELLASTEAHYVSVSYAFDPYRTLHSNLKSLPLSESTPAGKLMTDFPVTYKASSWGVALTKEQLMDRCRGLNVWMGRLLDNFQVLPAPAKQLVYAFLRITPGGVDPVHTAVAAILNKEEVPAEVEAQLCPPPPLPEPEPQPKSLTVSISKLFRTSSPSSPEDTEDSRSSANRDVSTVSPDKQSESSAGAGAGAGGGGEDVSAPVTAPAPIFQPPPQPIGASLKPIRIIDNSVEVSVSMGDLTAKNDNDRKLHYGYETVIKVLTMPPVIEGDDEATARAAANFIPEVMEIHAFTVAFNAYRELKDKLLRLDVGKGLNFCKTYSKSSLGISLTRDELEERVSSLHQWMSVILGMYPTMRREGQRAIVEFLQPVSKEVLIALAHHKGDDDYDDEEGEDRFTNTVPGAAASGASGGGRTGGSSLAKVSSPGSVGSRDDDTRSVGSSSIASSANRRGSVRGSIDANQYNEVGMDNVPTQLPGRMQCLVLLGALKQKAAGKNKVHLSYQLVITQGLVMMSSDKAGQNVITVTHPFDSYRQLNAALSKVGLTEDKIDSPFPPTYSQSSLGIALTRDQVSERCAGLNAYMGSLLQALPTLTSEAKSLIINFLEAKTAEQLQMIALLENPPVDNVTDEGLKKEVGDEVEADPRATGGQSSDSTAVAAPTPASSFSFSSPSSSSSSASPSTSSLSASAPDQGNLSSASARLSVEEDPNSSISLFKAMDTSLLNAIGNDNPPTVIGALQVHVLMGGLAGKSDSDKKMHVTYQTVLRLADKASSGGGVVHSVTSAFDGYRKLNEELVRLGVTIPAEFSPTYGKSRLGISLTKDELEHRLSTLNRWMGSVLSHYSLLPQAAQMAVTDFLDIDFATVAGANSRSRSSVVSSSVTGSAESAGGGGGGRGSAGGGEGEGGGGLVNILSVLEEVKPQTPAVAVVSGNSRPSTLTSSVSRASMGTDKVVEEEVVLSSLAGPPAALIHHWLMMQVTFGESKQKTSSSSKLHVTYEVSIKFRDLSREFDFVEAITRVKKGVTLSFDRFRDLSSELTTHGVGRERDLDPKKLKCAISAPFPETFQLSALGVGLSKDQLLSRCNKLHAWMAAVLLAFHAMPKPAKDAVVNFLRIDADDPSEPENSIIVDILGFGPQAASGNISSRLSDLYSPPPPPPPQEPNQKGKKPKGNNGKATGGSDDMMAPAACCSIS